MTSYYGSSRAPASVPPHCALLKDRGTLERLYDSIVSKLYAFMWVTLNRSGSNDVFHDGFGPGITIRQEGTGEEPVA